MSEWIKLSGVLQYEPDRGPCFKKQFKTKTLIVELGGRWKNQIDLYYQWHLKKKFGSYLELQRPMFGNHVTVVRGDECPKNKEYWKKYVGHKIEFEYSLQLELKYTFWQMPVRSEALQNIRLELGMKRLANMHLTIGRQFDWQPKIRNNVISF